MGVITLPNVFSSGTTILSADVNSNFSTLYNEFNGSISNANISGSAAIDDTKLAQITTGGKVLLSALTVSGQVAGDTMYFNGTNWIRLAKGTAGQIYFMNSGATAPEWASLTATNALTGSVVQAVNTSTGAVATGTTLIPFDDTIPQNTEGDEYMTLAITPTSASNILKIDIVFLYAVSVNAGHVIAALFQDATASALACAGFEANSSELHTIGFTHWMVSGTTSETTFKVRAGNNESSTLTFNGTEGVRRYGGVLSSSITITEIKA